MRIPPAIDSAMWEVVESGDQALMDEFAARYPEHKGELAKRLAMVRDLKGSKPKAAAAAPVFQPRNDIEIPRQSLTWTTPGVLLAVAGAALVTFGTIRLYDVLKPQAPAPTVTTQPTSDLRLYQPPTTPVDTNPRVTPEQTQPNNPAPQITPAPIDPFQSLVTIATEDAPLSSVLQQIASQANLVLEAAPGMPDDHIHAQYANVPAMQVLEDLGRNFGFTAMKQGRRSALLIPARDRTGTKPSSSTGLPPTNSQDPTATTGGASLTGPVNAKDKKDEVLPPIGE